MLYYGRKMLFAHMKSQRVKILPFLNCSNSSRRETVKLAKHAVNKAWLNYNKENTVIK